MTSIIKNNSNSNNSKKILIISYYFAPGGTVGAKRFTFLSKILQEQFPELYVLTVKEKYLTSRDNSLSSGGEIHRVAMYPPFPIQMKNQIIIEKICNRLWTNGYFCLIDPYSGWILPGLIRGLKIVKAKKINTVIATGPPFSTMVIGLLLKSIANVSLILDYRDPWTNIDLKFYNNKFVKKTNTLLEIVAIKNASAIVFNTHNMKDNFLKSFGTYTKAVTHVITNGFHTAENIQPLSLGNKKINMVYAGVFYGERKISLLLEPLSRLLEEGLISKDNFCFHIFGTLKNSDKEAIKEYNLQGIVKEHLQVPHNHLLQLLRSANILVLIISKKMSYSVSYKFYDYLSVKRPIFAIVPEKSQMQKIMNQIDCGRSANIDNPESIYQNLRAMLLNKREYSFSGSDQYAWDELGRKYSEIIRSL